LTWSSIVINHSSGMTCEPKLPSAFSLVHINSLCIFCIMGEKIKTIILKILDATVQNLVICVTRNFCAPFQKCPRLCLLTHYSWKKIEVQYVIAASVVCECRSLHLAFTPNRQQKYLDNFSLTNYMKQTPWKSSSSSASQNIPYILQNFSLHYHIKTAHYWPSPCARWIQSITH
jgi:hypothetical protein